MKLRFHTSNENKAALYNHIATQTYIFKSTHDFLF